MALYSKLLRPHTIRQVSPYIHYRAFTPAAIAMGPRVSDTIIKDHRELEDYFNRIVSSTDPTEQTAFQNQFTWELARHSVGEELIVYPAFEKHLKDGAKMADKDRREHQSVRVPPHPCISE